MPPLPTYAHFHAGKPPKEQLPKANLFDVANTGNADTRHSTFFDTAPRDWQSVGDSLGGAKHHDMMSNAFHQASSRGFERAGNYLLQNNREVEQKKILSSKRYEEQWKIGTRLEQTPRPGDVEVPVHHAPPLRVGRVVEEPDTSLVTMRAAALRETLNGTAAYALRDLATTQPPGSGAFLPHSQGWGRNAPAKAKLRVDPPPGWLKKAGSESAPALVRMPPVPMDGPEKRPQWLRPYKRVEVPRTVASSVPRVEKQFDYSTLHPRIGATFGTEKRLP